MRQCEILDTTETQRHRESRLTKSLMPLSRCLCVSVVSNISAERELFLWRYPQSQRQYRDMWNTTRYRTRVLGLLCLLMVITYLDRVCISVAGPRIQEALRSVRCVAGATIGAMNTYGNYDAPFIPMAGLLLIGAWLWVKVNPAKQLVSGAKVVIQTAAQHAHV